MESALEVFRKEPIQGDRSSIVTLEIPWDKYVEVFDADPNIVILELRKLAIMHKLVTQASNLYPPPGEPLRITLMAQENPILK